MKSNKMITLDMDLILELNKLHVNVSDECNQHLWTLITKQKTKAEQTKNIESEIEKLQIEKAQREREVTLLEARKEAGIDEKMLKFLKAMNTNIMCTKDNKKAWLNLTGDTIVWDDLKALKAKWT